MAAPKHHAHDLHRYPWHARRSLCGLRIKLMRLHQLRELVDCVTCQGLIEHGGKAWIYRNNTPPVRRKGG